MFALIQLVLIPVIALAMPFLPWRQSLYETFGEFKVVIFFAIIIVALHIVALIAADMSGAPQAGIATFFSGIICIIILFFRIAIRSHRKTASLTYVNSKRAKFYTKLYLTHCRKKDADCVKTRILAEPVE